MRTLQKYYVSTTVDFFGEHDPWSYQTVKMARLEWKNPTIKKNVPLGMKILQK